MPKISLFATGLCWAMLCLSACHQTSPNRTSNLPSSAVPSLSDISTVSPYITVDQFGYLPAAQKIAVIRDPQVGFDAGQSFAPASHYHLVNLDTQVVVHSGPVSAWQNGAVYDTAGDRIWWYDFSAVTESGRYAIVDHQNRVRSPEVRIGVDVYKPILKHALRTFYYQRAGHAKVEPYAEPGWTDAASHLGPGQDRNARLYNGDASTEQDLSGGWYDAGDYNKYTSWHANYLVSLLHAYRENPSIWTDDFNLPESNNGVPDLLDEIQWGFAWLMKMQQENGAVLSILSLDHASPPSAATGPSVYGPASTSATLASAAAFAYGAKVFAALENERFSTFAKELGERARSAWVWADANPDVVFYNNDPAHGTQGIGAGQQEVDDAGRLEKKRTAAIYLFALTGDAQYRRYVDEHVNPIARVTPWNEEPLTSLLYYAALPNATDAVAKRIHKGYLQAIEANLTPIRASANPYLAHMDANHFTWGSNRSMAQKGSSLYNLLSFKLGEQDETEIKHAALGYIHYLHGVNPLSMVYLSSMYRAGAHHSVNEFYHTWFTNGSILWDRVGVSKYGPAPGFLVGGPNPRYDWDKNCTSSAPHNACGAAPPSPPKGQPAMKAYLDFNTSWPLNSWEVTENHNHYQVAYIRLLSKFVQ